MTISEVIARLQDILQHDGDLRVYGYIPEYDEDVPMESIAVSGIVGGSDKYVVFRAGDF